MFVLCDDIEPTYMCTYACPKCMKWFVFVCLETEIIIYLVVIVVTTKQNILLLVKIELNEYFFTFYQFLFAYKCVCNVYKCAYMESQRDILRYVSVYEYSTIFFHSVFLVFCLRLRISCRVLHKYFLPVVDANDLTVVSPTEIDCVHLLCWHMNECVVLPRLNLLPYGSILYDMGVAECARKGKQLIITNTLALLQQ